MQDADGFGKTRSPDGQTLIKIWLKIRKDREIPDFDAIEKLEFALEGPDDPYTDRLVQMVTEHMGMFVNDALKLTERDIEPGVEFIPALRALKKAIHNYFEESGQLERYRKATEKLICSCRNVTDQEIKDLIAKGKSSLEEIQVHTGAGTGCGTCLRSILGLIDTLESDKQ